MPVPPRRITRAYPVNRSTGFFVPLRVGGGEFKNAVRYGVSVAPDGKPVIAGVSAIRENGGSMVSRTGIMVGFYSSHGEPFVQYDIPPVHEYLGIVSDDELLDARHDSLDPSIPFAAVTRDGRLVFLALAGPAFGGYNQFVYPWSPRSMYASMDTSAMTAEQVLNEKLHTYMGACLFSASVDGIEDITPPALQRGQLKHSYSVPKLDPITEEVVGYERVGVYEGAREFLQTIGARVPIVTPAHDVFALGVTVTLEPQPSPSTASSGFDWLRYVPDQQIVVDVRNMQWEVVHSLRSTAVLAADRYTPNICSEPYYSGYKASVSHVVCTKDWGWFILRANYNVDAWLFRVNHVAGSEPAAFRVEQLGRVTLQRPEPGGNQVTPDGSELGQLSVYGDMLLITARLDADYTADRIGGKYGVYGMLPPEAGVLPGEGAFVFKPVAPIPGPEEFVGELQYPDINAGGYYETLRGLNGLISASCATFAGSAVAPPEYAHERVFDGYIPSI